MMLPVLLLLVTHIPWRSEGVVTVTGCMVVDIPGGGVGCSEMK